MGRYRFLTHRVEKQLRKAEGKCFIIHNNVECNNAENNPVQYKYSGSVLSSVPLHQLSSSDSKETARTLSTEENDGFCVLFLVFFH